MKEDLENDNISIMIGGILMIKLKNINKSYDKENQVLSDVSLNINKGEIYGLIGKNGAGKTTIFKIILGLTEYDSGSLFINGKNNKKELSNERKNIGFFIGKNFFDYLDGKDNLEYFRKIKNIKDKNEVDRVLKIVGLDKVNKKYKNYSMGMKQRLGIANALLGNPDILILDEPTNGLDPEGIYDIRKLVKNLNEKYNKTIIISSHILGELENTANIFGIVHNGSIIREISRESLDLNTDTIEIKVSDLEKTKKILNENNIEILNENIKNKTLEDYYFELIGGHRDV